MAVIKVTSDSMVYTLTATCTFRFEEILKVALNQCKATVKPLIASVDAPDAFLGMSFFSGADFQKWTR